MPGFVDAHMHETLTRGLNEDLPLEEWLERICFPIDRAYTPDIMRAAAMLNQLEMIRGGITTFVDIYRHPATAAEVAEASGLRAIFTPQIIEVAPGAGETLDTNQEFIDTWNERNERIPDCACTRTSRRPRERSSSVKTRKAAHRPSGSTNSGLSVRGSSWLTAYTSQKPTSICLPSEG